MIRVQDLSFTYERALRPALDRISLEIPPGTITAILGPNGSGKTTLLHLLLGILSPTQGTILIAGQPREEYTRRMLSRMVGLVPQDENVPFELDVLEYVLLGRAPYLGLMEKPGRDDEEAALAVLEATGLIPLIQRTVPSLSGGERQLVTVARALAQEPRILLLDEPTSHLDLRNTRRILQIARELAGRGVTIVFTTHDPNAAAASSDRVVLLRRGQVVAAGAVREVLTSETLTATYEMPVEVIQVGERPVVLV
jgi:iron complex transport system ATP-binding protein